MHVFSVVKEAVSSCLPSIRGASDRDATMMTRRSTSRLASTTPARSSASVLWLVERTWSAMRSRCSRRSRWVTRTSSPLSTTSKPQTTSISFSICVLAVNCLIGYAQKAVRDFQAIAKPELIPSASAYYERDACHLVRIIAGAVDYLHDQGIVHRGRRLPH